MHISNYRKRWQALPRIAKLYLVRQYIAMLYFAWPAWYGFASQKLTPFQVGIYFSVLYLTQLVAEIPTGMYADTFGRRKAALFGACLAPFSPLVVYFGHSFPAYCIAAFIFGVAAAFLSGSLDSLVYDDHQITPSIYRTISMLEVSMTQAGLISSAALGGWLYAINPGIPFIAEAFAGFISLICIYLMQEQSTAPFPEHSKGYSYIGHMRDGLKYLLATRDLKYLVAAYILCALGITAGIEFVNEAAMIHYGIQPELRGILLSSVKILNLILLHVLIFRFVTTDKAKLYFATVISTIVFMTMSISNLPLFLAAFIAFNWVSAARTAFFYPILHEFIPSSHRSTSMSSLSALVGISSLILYPISGWIIDYFDNSLAAYSLFAALAFCSVVCIKKVQHYNSPR